MRRWDPSTNFERYRLASVHIWIRLLWLSPQLWSSYHEDGQCHSKAFSNQQLYGQKEKRLAFARIFVEINAVDILHDNLKIGRPTGEIMFQKVEYEWITSRCRSCLSFGHTLSQCPDNGQTNGDPSQNLPKSSQEGTSRLVLLVREQSKGSIWIQRKAECSRVCRDLGLGSVLEKRFGPKPKDPKTTAVSLGNQQALMVLKPRCSHLALEREGSTQRRSNERLKGSSLMT